MANKNYNKMSQKSEEVIGITENATENVEETQDKTVKPRYKIGYVVNCERLNMRTEPSINSDVVTILDKNTKVKVYEDNVANDFYTVSVGNNNGFCMAKYIKIK